MPNSSNLIPYSLLLWLRQETETVVSGKNRIDRQTADRKTDRQTDRQTYAPFPLSHAVTFLGRLTSQVWPAPPPLPRPFCSRPTSRAARIASALFFQRPDRGKALSRGPIRVVRLIRERLLRRLWLLRPRLRRTLSQDPSHILVHHRTRRDWELSPATLKNFWKMLYLRHGINSGFSFIFRI